MSETLVLKVLCGACGRRIGEVYRPDDGATRFRPVYPHGSAADSTSPARFWCVEHGWADPGEVEAAVPAPGDRLKTLRAHLSR